MWSADKSSSLVLLGFALWPLIVGPLKIVVLTLHESDTVGNKLWVSDLLFEYIQTEYYTGLSIYKYIAV